MKVIIYNSKTKLLVTEVKISYGLIGEKTVEQDVIDEAWLSAVEDGVVDSAKRDEYILTLVT